MGEKISIIQEGKRLRPSKSEVRRLVGTNNKLKKMTGWAPPSDGLNSFLSGLEKTISWIKKTKFSSKKSGYTI